MIEMNDSVIVKQICDLCQQLKELKVHCCFCPFVGLITKNNPVVAPIKDWEISK